MTSATTYKQLHEALLDAFTSLDDFDRMMRYEIDRVRAHYSTASGLIKIIDDVLQVAASEGWLNDLVNGATRYMESNRKLLAAQAQLRAAAAPSVPTSSRTAAFAADSYSVATIAGQTALGGAIGWSVVGLIIGVIAADGNTLLGALVGLGAGIGSGYLGGGLAGLLTGAVVRKVSPRFARSQLRRLGAVWAVAIFAAMIGGLFVGRFFVAGVIDRSLESADMSTIEAAFGAICGAVIVGLVFLLLAALGGMVAGSGIIGWIISRQLRLAAEGISRRQSFVIAVGWFISGIATMLLLVMLLAALLGN